VLGNRDFVLSENGVQHIKSTFPHLLLRDQKIKLGSGKIFITSNKDLTDKRTIYVTHYDRQLSNNTLLQIAGHVHWGVRYRNYLNLGFLYRDEAHGASETSGCYWEIDVDESGKSEAEWRSLGGMKEVRCAKHSFATFYIPSNWKRCPLCYEKDPSEWEIFKNDIPGYLYFGSQLLSIPLVGYARAQILERLGITRVDEIARLNPSRLAHFPDIKNAKDRSFAARIPMVINYAKAIMTGKTIITGTPQMFEEKHDNAFFFDLEYDPVGTQTRGSVGVFLIGMMDIKGATQQYFAEDPKEEEQLLLKFNEWLATKQPFLITFSSTSADEPQLRNAYRKFGIPCEALNKVRFLDLFYDIIFTQSPQKQKVYLPLCGSMGAKHISDYFGYKEPKGLQIRDGLQALTAYKDYLRHKRKKIKDQLLLYNQCDLQRTAIIYNKLRQIFLGDTGHW